MSAVIPFKAMFDQSWPLLLSRLYRHKEPLHTAMRYALDGEGKRVRAVLSLLVADMCGGSPRKGLSSACAVEMVHTYSLAHDDLPCMDNDDWRRGKPSLHKAFGEATALLAGDAILTDAFRVLVDEVVCPESALVRPQDRALQVALLASAAGGQGMVLGQSLDLLWTNQRETFTEDMLQNIHFRKTGALIGASCSMAAAACEMTPEDIKTFDRFGQTIGQAFQAVDDALDESSTSGKTAGKDKAQGKLTYRHFYSKSEIQDKAYAMTQEILESLPSPCTPVLRLFVESLVYRTT